MNEAKRDPDDIEPALDEAGRIELQQRRAQIEAGETELVAWDDVRAQLLSK